MIRREKQLSLRRGSLSPLARVNPIALNISLRRVNDADERSVSLDECSDALASTFDREDTGDKSE